MKLTLLLFLLGVSCLVAFKYVGSTIDAAGIVHEPFILIILGWMLIGFSLMTGAISGIYRVGRRIYKAL